MIKQNDVAAYLNQLKDTLQSYYGERLMSLAVFGSLARDGFKHSHSDIDLLVVLKDPLPSHFKRNKEFLEAEGKLSETVMSDKLSPVIRSVKEITAGTPLMLDMTEEIIILYDKEQILKKSLLDLTRRLRRLNAKRIFRGDRWYWILKPDIQWGEVFTI